MVCLIRGKKMSITYVMVYGKVQYNTDEKIVRNNGVKNGKIYIHTCMCV